MSLTGFLCFNEVCDWISSIFNGGRTKTTTIGRSASRQDIDAFDRIDELQSRIDDLEDQLLVTDIESERYDEIEDQIYELESEIDDWNDSMIDDY